MLETALALGSLDRDEAAGAPALAEQFRASVRGSELEGAALELRPGL